ncbi:MAG: pyridoxal phosphate-dependent aminotransferase [Candidatus Krumholzibacteria bacterium]|nr:pyridoxal phosphate-dependent aminotransferase [Candidatus Krumholzibacteria bacterium]
MSGIISNRASDIEPSITLSLNTRANELKEKGEDVVGLAAGEPDFDTPEVIKKAAVDAIQKGKTKYTPAAGIFPLRKAVAETYSERLGLPYSPEEVVVSNGAKHSIFNALYTLIDPGEEVLILSPYWTSYPEMIKILGGRPRVIELTEETDYKLTVKRLEDELSKGRPRALLFNSPGNPAGTVYGREELEPIARLILNSGLSLISDEIYEFLTYDGCEHYSPVTLVPELKERSVVVTGVSKGYSMTGWRIGFALTEKRVAYRMAAFQAHATGCPNSISQWAALGALTSGAEDRDRMRKEFEKRKRMFSERLARIPSIKYIEPGGAFYFLVDVSGLYGSCGVSGSSEFCDKLLDENGLLLIPGGAFGCDGMVRFSFAAGEDDLNRALDRFEDFVRRYLD